MSTPFEVLSRMITVRDLSEPISRSYETSEPVADIFPLWWEECDERGEDPMDQIGLATAEGHVVGWFGFDMLDTGKTIGECAEPIAAEAIIAADTPAIEAVKIFNTTAQHFFFTLEKNALSGWLGYSDLFKLPFRLCLFSLLLGIEQLASDLCKTQLRASLDALKPDRLEKVKDTYRRRGLKYDQAGNEYDSPLLDCTMFLDKITIIRKLFVQSVPAAKDRLFNTAESIRNDLAHPRDGSVIADRLQREKLLPLIAWSETIQQQMEQALGRS